MPSKIHRRSGTAVTQMCQLLDWNPDVVWQVGVGVNCQELDCLLEVYPFTKFVGFEPHPVIFKRKADSYPGFLINAAVSDCSKSAVLYSKPRHKDGSSLFLHNDENNNQTPFDCRTTYLDYPELIRIQSEDDKHLLWLDCEGSELDVLHGAREFIKRVQAVNVELTGVPQGEGWCSMEEVHQQLVDDGFYLQLTHTSRIPSGQIDGLYVRGELFNPSYCNCPPEILRYKENQ